MSKRFESWMLGLAAIAVSSSALCPVSAAQAKSPHGKTAPAKAAAENAPTAETPLLTIGAKAPAIDIEHWISDQLTKVGCETARNVTDVGQEELVKRTDLEAETVAEVLRILKVELEQ